MEERQHAEEARGRYLDRIDLREVRHEVAMRQHHALRQPGRAGRVRQHDDIGCGSIDGWRIGIDGDRGERRRLVGVVNREDVDRMRRHADRGPCALEERRHGDKQPGSRVAELKGELLRGVRGIGGREDRTETGDRVEDHGVLGNVRGPDRDDVALADPAPRQARRQPPDLVGQLRRRSACDPETPSTSAG